MMKYKVSNMYDAEDELKSKKNGLSSIRRRSSVKSDKTKEEDVDTVSFFSLYRYSTRKDRVFIFFAIIFSIACGCLVPLNTLLFSSVLEDMVMYGTQAINSDTFFESVQRFAILNTVLGICLVLLSYLATIFMNFASQNQIHKIRQEYLRAALNQDFEYYDVHQTGDFASKMSDDVIKLEDGIGEKLTIFIYYQASFVSCVVMALVIGWKLALLCLISFPVTLTLVGVTGLIASGLSKKERVEAGKASSVAEEVISSIHTVFAFGGQEREIARYDVHLKEMRKINVKKGLYNGMTMGFLFICIFGTYAMSFWFGYQLMVNESDNYTVATMMAVFLGIVQGSASFGTSTILMEVFGIARGSGSHIFHLIDRVPTINPFLDKGIRPKDVTGEIEFKDVKFTYPSRPDIQILNGINIKVRQGEVIALVGHSGCGKSTIVQLISRYYDVGSGAVLVDGHDVRELSVNWLRSQIGLVEQDLVLFNTTVRENIRYGFEGASDKTIEDAARLANAHKFIMKLPKGYDTLVGERGASLSGGQKQRIAIARAMVRNPRILLLDEATSALDTASEAKVQRALDKAQQGRTTIIVAHRLSTIRNVNTIHVLKSGSIVESGNHEELMQKKGLYYNMVMVQGGADADPGAESPHTPFLSTQSSFVDNDADEEVIVKTETVPEDKEASISFLKVIMLNRLEWKSVTVASICAFVNGFAMPLIGVIIGDFIGALSNPTPSEVLDAVRTVVIIFVSLGVVTGILNFMQVFFYAIAGEYLTQRLRKTLFEKYLSFEIAFYDDKSNSTGALVAKLSSEAASVQGATGQRIGTVLQAIGTFIFGLSLSLYFEWRIGLVVLTSVPFIALILFKQVQMTSAESVTNIRAIEASSKIAIDAVSNVRTVAAIGREQKFLEEYAAALLPAVIIAKRSSHWRGVVFGLSRGLFNFIYAASIYYGATLMVNDGISYDTVFKAVQALLMGATSATQAFAFAPNFQKGIKAARRIMQLLRRPTKINDPEKPAIENFIGSGEAALQDVQFHYPTRPMIQVLKNFSLNITGSKTVALVGPSGSGKSTVVQLLVRFYDADAGIVSLDRIPLPRLRVSDVRKTLGIVSQMPVLFDRSIGENIAYGDNSRKIKENEIIDAAKQANIHNFITSLPQGYDTNVGSKGVQLSGGQKQRIAIARALVRQPKILLLDEATSALDTESEKVVQEALDVAKTGRTCVMIAHRLSTVRDADLICVLSEGRLIECGTHSELMNLKGMYYNLNRHSH